MLMLWEKIHKGLGIFKSENAFPADEIVVGI